MSSSACFNTAFNLSFSPEEPLVAETYEGKRTRTGCEKGGA